MRIGGASSYSYLNAQLKANAALGVGNNNSSTSSSSSFPWSATTSSAPKAPNMSDVLNTAYQFSNTLRTSAMATKTSMAALEGFGSEATKEFKKDGKVSEETTKDIQSSLDTFSKTYNSSVNSLYYAPSYSKSVQGIEKGLKDAVTNNFGALQKIGFSKDEDGKLSLDKEKFKKMMSENPSAINDVFKKSSSFSNALSNPTAQAMDTRSINKAEISKAVKENYQLYLNTSVY